MTALCQTEVDGVPTVWMPVPGPLRAALTVRVGSADETFVNHGISHLLEHLALFGLGRPGDHSNGFVDQTRSVFSVEGDDGEVRDFLGSLTRQLADPPVQRLDDERGVILAEEAQRGPALLDSQLLWRYGASGYGLAGIEQAGIRQIGVAALQDWSRRFATRANSVLWISGPPPAGLRLHLPDGVAQPAPDPRAGILPWAPAWFTGPDDRVTLDSLVTRGWPASALAEILRGRLVDELRTRKAVAYSPDTSYQRLTLDTARLVAHSDLVAGRQSEGVRPLLTMLERLAAEPGSATAVTAAELEGWRARGRRNALDPHSGLGILDASGWDILHGGVPTEAEQWLSEMSEVTGEQVAAAAREAQQTVLAQIPNGLAPQAESWRPAPSSQAPRLTGTVYRSRHRDGRADSTIALGPEGITLADGEQYLTVPVASTVGVLNWPDGRRVLVGADGNRLVVEPTLWRDGSHLLAQVDQTWPADLTVRVGSRPPAAIPQPAGRAKKSLSRWSFQALTGSGVILLLALVLGAGLLVASAIHNRSNGLVIPSPVLSFFVAAFLVSRYRVWRAEPEKREPAPRPSSATAPPTSGSPLAEDASVPGPDARG